MSNPWRRRTLLASLVSLPWVAREVLAIRLPESASVVVRQGWVLSKDD